MSEQRAAGGQAQLATLLARLPEAACFQEERSEAGVNSLLWSRK